MEAALEQFPHATGWSIGIVDSNTRDMQWLEEMPRRRRAENVPCILTRRPPMAHKEDRQDHDDRSHHEPLFRCRQAGPPGRQAGPPGIQVPIHLFPIEEPMTGQGNANEATNKCVDIRRRLAECGARESWRCLLAALTGPAWHVPNRRLDALPDHLSGPGMHGSIHIASSWRV